MKTGDKTAIVCCSNGQPENQKEKIAELQKMLVDVGLEPVMSRYIYAAGSVWSGAAEDRASELMTFYRDPEIKAVFDISGGDIANELLPYLDFDVIAGGEKVFWGYSDLTTIINAIYSQTGKKSVLYQVRNLVSPDGLCQRENFRKTVLENKKDLFDFRYSFIQQTKMKGIVVGGNIRCLLKLAGTKYWPDMNGKILFLEARGGTLPQMATYFSQLKQIGVFEQAAGILLGTFLKTEEANEISAMIELVKYYAGEELPVAYTKEIGHRTESKGLVIGEELELRMSNYEITKLQTEKLFLQYDQEKILRKFPLKYDEKYIYIDFIRHLYRIERSTGKICWSSDGFVHMTEADYHETMTIYDVLCYSREDCSSSEEFVNMQSLSSIRGSTGSVGGGVFDADAKFFDHKDEVFSAACEKLGGIRTGKGDVAYEIPLFDFLNFRIQFWDSDEEFDACLQFFMDKNILQYMHYETIWYAVGHLLKRIREEM